MYWRMICLKRVLISSDVFVAIFMEIAHNNIKFSRQSSHISLKISKNSPSWRCIIDGINKPWRSINDIEESLPFHWNVFFR